VLGNRRTLRFALILMLSFSSHSVFAQQSLNSANDAATESRSWKLGTEVDVLPYAMGGYYGSAFLGHDGWRFRGVAARSDTPSFLVTNGFEKKRTDAYALLADRFFGSKRTQLKGFWVGGGGEYWQSRIRQAKASDFTHYDNFVLTAGGGYVWKLSNHFYLNPWSAMHVVVAGDRNIIVSGRMYQQPRLTPEASLKFGCIF
jgi:hypothetical protein